MPEAPQVERLAGLAWISGSGVCRSWNGIGYKLGMSGKNVGATALSMNVAVIPPGGIAGAHIHVGFEVMLYILEGRVRHDLVRGLCTAWNIPLATSSSSSLACRMRSITSATPNPSSPSSRDRAPMSGTISSCQERLKAEVLKAEVGRLKWELK